MATWVIGDVQGCLPTLRALLRRIGDEPARDRLWLAGDLVNRGKHNAETLRWAMDQGERLVAVLGNHDLHALALARGVGRERKKDGLDDLLGAPDRSRLLDWLAARPLLHREGDDLLVHAGLHPGWTIDRAATLADEAQAWLPGPRGVELLGKLEQNHRARGDGHADDFERVCDSTRILVAVRTVDGEGRIEPAWSGPPAGAPPGCQPWFSHPDRVARPGSTIYCGHWSQLGLYRSFGVRALDTGCVWGGPLTALRRPDAEGEERVVQQPHEG